MEEIEAIIKHFYYLHNSIIPISPFFTPHLNIAEQSHYYLYEALFYFFFLAIYKEIYRVIRFSFVQCLIYKILIYKNTLYYRSVLTIKYLIFYIYACMFIRDFSK